MQICIIEKSEGRIFHGFKISEREEFRSLGIYRATLSRKISGRKLSCLIKKLRKRGVTLAAVYHGFSSCEFVRNGISVVDGSGIFKVKISEMARIFAKKNAIPLNVVIHGGGFYESARVALELLPYTKTVYVDSPEFDAISEVVSERTGAVIRNKFPSDALHIYLGTAENFLRYKDISGSFSDFDIEFPDAEAGGIKMPNSPAIAETLVICGILSENDIKTVFSQKENTEY